MAVAVAVSHAFDDPSSRSGQALGRVVLALSNAIGVAVVEVVEGLLAQGPAFNVARMWGRFAEAIRTDTRAEPDFDTAVTRHRLLEAIQRASDKGQRQRVA